jgi:hypothetical protein
MGKNLSMRKRKITWGEKQRKNPPKSHNWNLIQDKNPHSSHHFFSNGPRLKAR